MVVSMAVSVGATPVPRGCERNALRMSAIFSSGGADCSRGHAAPGSHLSAVDARTGLLPAANPCSKISARLVAAAIAQKGPSAAIRGTAIRRYALLATRILQYTNRPSRCYVRASHVALCG